MRKRFWAIAVIGVAISLVVLGFNLGRTSQTSTASQSSSGPFYLAFGASSSVGMQPTGIPSRNGHFTADGYPEELAQFEQRNGVDFTIHHIACPGETAQSVLMINDGGQCNVTGTAQLTKALTFLRENDGLAGLVTIDVGFNDLRPCYPGGVRDAGCVARGLAFVKDDLPPVLAQIMASAGSKVVVVGMEYADPFLAYYVLSPTGLAVAEASLIDFNSLNAVLDEDYTAAGFAVADVATMVEAQDASPMAIANVGTIPTNVAQICYTTWMCEPPPFGPDDHANNAGYMLAAEAIAKVLPAPWMDYPVK